MKVRCLQTTGEGFFKEVEYEKNEPAQDEIEVRAIMTGVCRSDIDMMSGDFGPLPLHMQGHEGLGIITRIGSEIHNVKVGEYVATRGEPAYADMYNVRKDEFVPVPTAHPRYILEPVACGIHLISQNLNEFQTRTGGRVLIIGSGFLAWVARNKLLDYHFYVDVLGNHNINLWGTELIKSAKENYDIVIDLSGKYQIGADIKLNNNALIIDAVGKEVSRGEAEQQLWRACTTVRPSPRHKNFINAMWDAKNKIQMGNLDVDKFWTQAYNRDTEWQQAFADGMDRPSGYSRGYIVWR